MLSLGGKILKHSAFTGQLEVSDGEDAELLDYLVEEEKGRLYRRASLCHLGSVQLNPFSRTETADPIRIYELAPLHRHSH
jgi:hypothetical protein